MANEQNLKPFTSENQPKNRKSRKGVKNRSTILKKWLEAKTEITNPITKKKEKGTVEDEVILGLITQARKGNVKAVGLILDSLYGKLTNKIDGGLGFEIVIRDETDDE